MPAPRRRGIWERPKSVCRVGSTHSCPRPLRRSRAAISQPVPEMHVHAFSPMEVAPAPPVGRTDRGFSTSGRGRAGVAARNCGRDSRRRCAVGLTKGKLPTATWVEVIESAHSAGSAHEQHDDVRPCRSSRTLADASAGARRVQDHASVTTVMRASPSSFRCPMSTTRLRSYLAGIGRAGPTAAETRAVHAAAAAAARPHRPRPGLLGQARRGGGPTRCSGPAPMISVAP